MKGEESKQCDECERKKTIKCLKEAKEALPDVAVGFGPADDYASGVIGGIRLALQGAIGELELMHKEATECGLPQKEEKE